MTCETLIHILYVPTFCTFMAAVFHHVFVFPLQSLKHITSYVYLIEFIFTIFATSGDVLRLIYYAAGSKHNYLKENYIEGGNGNIFVLNDADA